jgi:predicted NAD/FAD-binding protein
VSRAFKTQILLPWLTASEGHPLEETKRSSARAILQLFAPSHPKHPLQKATTWSSGTGFQGTIMTLARQCQNTSFHTSQPVARIEKSEGRWFVHSKDVRHGPFDAVVINAPPWESKKLLGRMPWADDLVGVLDRYEHLSHRLAIHTDPTYMHRDRRNWGLANVGIQSSSDGASGAHSQAASELSIWMQLPGRRPSPADCNVFKSWATYRSRQPKEILFERTFQHSIKTPDMMAAARNLKRWQGKEGLWFAGQFTSGIDLQESALRSAMDVARALSPSSAHLEALVRRASVAA